MSPFAGAVSARIGARVPLVVGPLLCAAGFVLLALPSIGGSYWTTFFPGVVVLGLGHGNHRRSPHLTRSWARSPITHAGVASGVNNAVSRAAALLAIAALGVVLRSRFDVEAAA